MSRVIIIDTETTGRDPYKGSHRVIEIGAVEIVNGKMTGNLFQTYVNPEGKKSTPTALKIHKISDNLLKAQPTFKEISSEFLKFISDSELCFYNKSFDMKFLQAEIDRLADGIVLSEKFKTSCLMLDIANKTNKGKNLSLDNACRRFKIDTSSRVDHGALIDAKITAELYIEFKINEKVPLERTPRKNKPTPPEAIPIPRAFEHPITRRMIQLNFCKNTSCENYGIPAKNPSRNKNGSPKRGLGNDYKLTGNVDLGKVLTCKLCNTSTRLINNRSFVIESLRNESLYEVSSPSCPNTGLRPDPKNNVKDGKRYKIVQRVLANGKINKYKRLKKPCSNQHLDIVKHPEEYIFRTVDKSRADGNESLLSQRVECKRCNTVFNVKLNPEKGLSRHDINVILFRGLVNKVVINRLQELLDVTPGTIYNRIEFFYEQCIKFDQWHMDNRLYKLKDRRLKISMDRQHMLVNWNDRSDTRPTKIVNTSSVENNSRFVFYSTVNFDFKTDYKSIRQEYDWLKDSSKPSHKRRYAQYVFSDTEIESDDADDALPLQLPANSLLVQQTYSLMAHLNLMKKVYRASKDVCLYADDDEGFELGICLVLKELIDDGVLYPVLVSSARNNASQMQDQQSRLTRMLMQQGINKDDKVDSNLIRKLAKDYWIEVIDDANTDSIDYKSEWVTYPFPKNKRSLNIKPLVKLSKEKSKYQSEALSEISLHGVDNYFQLLRRRINLIERPVTSATNGKRWNGYASYNPKWVLMLIEIFRVYNNYVLTDEKSIKNSRSQLTPTTPAQKLSIADKAYKIEDILNFSLIRETINNQNQKTNVNA